MTNLHELAKEINDFLFEYATTNPNSEELVYTFPDTHELKYCADMLEKNKIPTRCSSEWGSGGYKPYSSQKGQTEHNYLVKTVKELINQKML